VHFTDFLLADILTSLAKPISDLALSACHATYGRPIELSLKVGFDEGAFYVTWLPFILPRNFSAIAIYAFIYLCLYAYIRTLCVIRQVPAQLIVRMMYCYTGPAKK
jgi:hypothetical protein